MTPPCRMPQRIGTLAMVLATLQVASLAQFRTASGLEPLFPAGPPELRLLTTAAIEAKADAGDAQACLEAARRAVAQSADPNARERLRIRLICAAEKGETRAWRLLGLHYMNQVAADGVGLVQTPELAAEAFSQAAASGDTPGRFLLGMLQLSGHGGGDAAKGEASIREAAEAGHIPACRQLGAHFAYPFRLPGGERPADPVAAKGWFLKGAEAGDPLSQYGLACLLLHGPETIRDRVEGGRWLQRAKAAGHPPAADLERFPIPDGGLFANDPLLKLHSIVQQIPAEMASSVLSARTPMVGWVDDLLNRRIQGTLAHLAKASGATATPASGSPRSADAGPGDPRRNGVWRETLASLRAGQRLPSSEVVATLASGKVPSDLLDPVAAHDAGEILWAGGPDLVAAPAVAVEWWVHAARLGNPTSMLRLGRLWMGGSAEKPDPSEGVLWIESAARLGNVEACREMARCLVEGVGRRTDLTEGLAWLIAGGVPESDPARSGLQARLGEREREAARKLARGLVPQTGGPNPTGAVQGVVPAR